MLRLCSSTTVLGNVLPGDLLPKFFALMVLHLLDFLPSCQRKLTEGGDSAEPARTSHFRFLSSSTIE